MRTIKDASSKDLQFHNLIDPIVNFLKRNWEVKGVMPKGYKEYLKDYREYKDMGDDSFVPEFDGLLNTSPAGLPLPDRLSLPHVAYDDKEQGRKPFALMVGILVGYGLQVGKRLKELETEKEIADLKAQNERLMNIVLEETKNSSTS